MNISSHKMDTRLIFRALMDILLPRTCAVCQCRLNVHENHICLRCRSDLPLTRFWSLGHNPMADRFNELLQDRMESFQPYAHAAALFYYKEDGLYRHIPHRLKYHGDIAIGRHFGKILGREISKSELFRDADIIVPVPLHWTRKWKRGYNQAEILARSAAQEAGMQTRTDILRRVRRTKTQTRVGINDKAANVHGAFQARIKKPDTLNGIRHVILIDDVFTSGSTALACFTALRKVFPPDVRISVATLAFVGGR